MIIIPENIISHLVRGILDTVYSDTMSQPNKEDTILYGIFGDLKHERINYFEEAAKVFDRSNSNPNKITTRLSFNTNFENMPTVYITTGQDDHKFSAIGSYDGSDDKVSKDKLVSNSMYSTMFSAETNIVIVTDGMEQMLIIYHVLRAMLLATSDTLSLSGLQNPKFGGNDILLNDEMIPKNIFMRTISLKYEYELCVPAHIWKRGGFIKSISTTGTPQNNG